MVCSIWQRLPILIYESLLELVEMQPKILYTTVNYTLATEEAERVGVDHIARSSVSGSAQTSAGVCVLDQHNSGKNNGCGSGWSVWVA